ncbi:hypothetical protein [Halomicrobium salinisoli]|uniref:hypothetical protein n=1 Tax=Halomicrobium salinisoli TaxID=2878391 RepID=UPI001CF0AC65|nr:hypothetical protein [Halomicrobium salinisoli]
MHRENALPSPDDVPAAVRRAYNRVVRPHLPEKIAVFNGVAVRRIPLLDLTDEFPAYEATLIDAVRSAVESGDDVVVVGGGWGVSSVVAARRAGPDGAVTAFEPARHRYRYVRETAALNGVDDRVAVRHALVGPGVKVDGDGSGAARLPPGDLPDCDVLVLDCEGAEADVLRHVDVEPRTIVVETHACFGTPEDATRDALDEQGYDVVERAADEPDRGIFVLTAE